jgi:hypothetical protein
LLPALPLTVSLSAPGQPSDESSAASAKAQGAPDDSAVGMPAAGVLAVPYDGVVGRHTGRYRRGGGGLRTMHAVLRL